MKIRLLTLTMFLSFFTSFAQDKPAYKLFTAKGKSVKYKKLVREALKSDMVFFGELHNNPISHWLELELAVDLAKQAKLQMGAEMFELDNQEALQDYLNSKIDYKTYTEEVRLWPNNKTDYQPLVEFSKKENLEFYATNIPRRFANMVFKGDFEALETLSKEEKSWIAPLPIPFDPDILTYREILEMMGDHGSPLLVKAQAIKDATMAHSILTNHKPNHIFLHFNGAFHSNKNEGIIWYIHKYKSGVKTLSIATVEQENISKLDKSHLGLADYILVVPSRMTKTY